MGEPRPDARWNWLTPMPCEMLHRFYLTQDNDTEKFGVTAGSEAVCMWQLQGWMISEWKKHSIGWRKNLQDAFVDVNSMISCNDFP